MKPQKLSTKSNPLGESMNLSEAFNQLKKEEHEASFDGLGNWLDQQSKKPNTMKNIYKIAASFVLATMILIACTVPVQQEEEIGYMIKGMASPESVNLKSKLAQVPGLDPTQISVHRVMHEEIGKGSAEELTEVIMILPEANYKAAEDKKAALSGIFDFRSIEILPIEDTVKRTIIESALHKFDIKLRSDVDDATIARKIEQFLHENSSIEGSSKVHTDENGVRYVELVIEEASGNSDGLSIEFQSNANANFQIKKGIETLHKDLSAGGEIRVVESSNMSEEEIRELKEQKQKLEEQKKNR